MLAVVQERYGGTDVLQVRDVAEPVPGPDEVLLRVRAASVHPDVWHVLEGRPYVLRLMGAGVRRPRTAVPGTDMAGTVVSVGADVTRFEPGEDVFGETVTGYTWINGGAYAEYAAVPASILAPKPRHLTFEQAAAVPTSALIALRCLRYEGGLRAGQRVLVNGAGGGVGMFAVQIAKAYGADVTGVDSAEKLEAVRSIGADAVVDHAREDFTRRTERYGLILDVPGNHSFAECRRVLAADGKYVLVGHDHFGRHGRQVLGNLPRFAGLVARSLVQGQLPRPTISGPSKAELMTELHGLLEARTVRPVIDRTFPMGEIAAAIGHLADGHARGKVVLTV